MGVFLIDSTSERELLVCCTRSNVAADAGIASSKPNPIEIRPTKAPVKRAMAKGTLQSLAVPFADLLSRADRAHAALAHSLAAVPFRGKARRNEGQMTKAIAVTNIPPDVPRLCRSVEGERCCRASPPKRSQRLIRDVRIGPTPAARIIIIKAESAIM